jgi:hypothetical protein
METSMNRKRGLGFVTALMLTVLALATPAKLKADWCMWEYFYYTSEYLDQNGDVVAWCWLDAWHSCSEPIHCEGDPSTAVTRNYEYGRCQTCYIEY